MDCESHNSIETYLQALRPRATSATYQSHQNCLTELSRWHRDNTDTPCDISLSTVINFLRDKQSDPTVSDATLEGYVGTTVNFITYNEGSPPNVVLDSIRTDLEGYEPVRVPEEVVIAVSDLLEYLAAQRYGKRTHSYLEVLLSIDSLAATARGINVDDVDFDQQQIHVPVSTRWLVGRVGIVERCVYPLSSEACQVLETYVDSHRHYSELEPNPLFTSTQGRASQNILRRNVRAACQTAIAFHRQVGGNGYSDLEKFMTKYDRRPLLSDIVNIDRDSLR